MHRSLVYVGAHNRRTLPPLKRRFLLDLGVRALCDCRWGRAGQRQATKCDHPETVIRFILKCGGGSFGQMSDLRNVQDLQPRAERDGNKGFMRLGLAERRSAMRRRRSSRVTAF